MKDNWRFVPVTEKHLQTPELKAFNPQRPEELAEFLLWESHGGRARVVYSGEQIAGLLSISPEHVLLAFVVREFRRQGLARAGLRMLMDQIVKERGETSFIATTKIGETGEAVARALGMTEVSRTEVEVFFELKLSRDPAVTGTP
jgi:hypothetical protein